jgi:hypothetical protein
MQFHDQALLCALSGALPLAATHPRVASFQYSAPPDGASAVREMVFAPGLDFDGLVRSVLEGGGASFNDAALWAAGHSGATSGAGREDLLMTAEEPTSPKRGLDNPSCLERHVDNTVRRVLSAVVILLHKRQEAAAAAQSTGHGLRALDPLLFDSGFVA